MAQARAIRRQYTKPILRRALAALLLAASVGAKPFTPADDWAGRFNFAPGRAFFDGGRSLRSEAVRVPIVERAPASTFRPVDATEGISGRALLDAVASLAEQGQRRRSYEDASDYLFSKADNIVINGVRGVVDAYSGVFVPGTSNDGSDYPERGDQNGDGYGDSAGMNVEHAWPQSLFKRALPMRSDLHHLMATFRHPNSIRDNLPFGVVTDRPEYENAAGAKRGGGIFEPPDAVKGRVARGLLYFYARYKDSRFFGRTSAAFWNRQIDTLLNWNRAHPPDAFEVERNNLVESYQGNRNPFVDNPGLADRIGAEALRASPPPSRGWRRQVRAARFQVERPIASTRKS